MFPESQGNVRGQEVAGVALAPRMKENLHSKAIWRPGHGHGDDATATATGTVSQGKRVSMGDSDGGEVEGSSQQCRRRRRRRRRQRWQRHRRRRRRPSCSPTRLPNGDPFFIEERERGKGVEKKSLSASFYSYVAAAATAAASVYCRNSPLFRRPSGSLQRAKQG